MQEPRYDYDPIIKRKKIEWPNGTRIALWVAPNIEYFHFGGTYGQATGKVRPFVVATIGATYMDPKGAGLNPETKFSLSLGGGVKFYLSEHVGIRLDGRWFGTFIGGSGSVFCSDGKCLIDVQGDVLSQFSANAGVILAF